MTTHPHPEFTSSSSQRIFCSLFLVAVGVAAAVASSRAGRQPGLAVSGSASAAQKIAPWVMEHTANNQQAEFFVVLADQADLSQAAGLHTKAEKGRYVYNTLLNKIRARKDQSFNGCVSDGCTIVPSISLTRF
jgi:hypothetical protein